jgi:hypothetical protein
MSIEYNISYCTFCEKENRDMTTINSGSWIAIAKDCIGLLLFFVCLIGYGFTPEAGAQTRPVAMTDSKSEIPAQNRDLTDFFPLEAGNQWTYGNGLNTFTVKVLRGIREMNGTDYFEISEYFQNDPSKTHKIRRGPDNQILEYNPGGEDFLWYRFGHSRTPWNLQTAGEVSCVTGSRVSVGRRKEIAGLPAGMPGRTLRFDFSAPCADAGISAEYFVRGIGLVQRAMTTIAGARAFKLVSAQVGSLSFPSAPYGIQISMDRPVYTNNRMPPIVTPWPTARVALVIQNNSESPVTFQFSTAQRFDFAVLETSGKEISRWSEGRTFAQVLGQEVLRDGSLVYAAEIQLKTRDGKPLPPGFYALTGRLTTQGSNWETAGISGSITFAIQDIY